MKIRAEINRIENRKLIEKITYTMGCSLKKKNKLLINPYPGRSKRFYSSAFQWGSTEKLQAGE